MAFHLRDNWFFERLDTEGTVRIYHEEQQKDEDDFAECDVCLDIDAASWASIVASVSKLGDIAIAYQRAIAFHQGDLTT